MQASCLLLPDCPSVQVSLCLSPLQSFLSHHPPLKARKQTVVQKAGSNATADPAFSLNDGPKCSELFLSKGASRRGEKPRGEETAALSLYYSETEAATSEGPSGREMLRELSTPGKLLGPMRGRVREQLGRALFDPGTGPFQSILGEELEALLVLYSRLVTSSRGAGSGEARME